MISTQRTGAYISRLRKKQNMTQAEMAANLMVSPQAVSKWETGQALPDAEQLLSLSQLFGVSINTLLAGEEPQAVPGLSGPEPESAATAPDATPASAEPDQAAVVRLAPFVDRQLLCDMVERAGLESFTLEQMEALAPFVSGDLLNRYAEQLPGIDARYLVGLAPFVSPSILDRLVDRLDTALTARQITRVAPFLSSERIGELFTNRADGADGDIQFEDLASLAPFLPGHLLQVQLETHPPRSFEEIQAVAPFLDRAFVNLLTRRLMAGHS